MGRSAFWAPLGVMAARAVRMSTAHPGCAEIIAIAQCATIHQPSIQLGKIDKKNLREQYASKVA
jgi:hypothetical protein